MDLRLIPSVTASVNADAAGAADSWCEWALKHDKSGLNVMSQQVVPRGPYKVSPNEMVFETKCFLSHWLVIDITIKYLRVFRQYRLIFFPEDSNLSNIT